MSETSSVAVDGPRHDEDTRVELKVPADGAYVSVLRTLSAGLAARLDFTLEDIEDLRIAVSEASAMVLDEAVAGSELVCAFELTAGRLSLTITTTAQQPPAPDYESFGWQVLATLATEADITTTSDTYAVRLVVASSLEPTGA